MGICGDKGSSAMSAGGSEREPAGRSGGGGERGSSAKSVGGSEREPAGRSVASGEHRSNEMSPAGVFVFSVFVYHGLFSLLLLWLITNTLVFIK